MKMSERLINIHYWKQSHCPFGHDSVPSPLMRACTDSVAFAELKESGGKTSKAVSRRGESVSLSCVVLPVSDVRNVDGVMSGPVTIAMQ